MRLTGPVGVSPDIAAILAQTQTRRGRFRRMRRAPVLAIGLGLACAGGGPEPSSPAEHAPAVGALPTDYAGCLSAGGRAEPARQGGRCYLVLPKGRDASAYLHCRSAGGLPRAAGPAASAEAQGESHVCTLVFEP